VGEGGQAEKKIGENIRCYCLGGPPRETVLLQPGQDVGLSLLQGVEGCRRHSFKRYNQKMFKCVGDP
jgi:hypothetical protein